ncbi:sulfurtransferase TusA family protein [Bacillus sp. FJAT-45350]|uniref:sulfurtransferase TusA family protein n=1 Tax=Bacillus sp. FJAT-45350 TaxID=2011014 RepID=UPI000BB93ADE|nr:sulfurtransferase TusA family protein [Bacillus sp. FJAT-45350]
MNIKANVVLDAKGLACPMPIVRTKKAMGELEPGKVIEIQATDKGSTADLKAWSESTGHQYIGTVEEEGFLKHYLRKSSGEENVETKHPNVISNEGLQEKLDSGDAITLLDVREQAEYAFKHIPGSTSIPLEELDEKIAELNTDSTIYVICRTGTRSDLVAQQLTAKGFKDVVNVVPGMSEWNGKTEETVK